MRWWPRQELDPSARETVVTCPDGQRFVSRTDAGSLTHIYPADRGYTLTPRFGLLARIDALLRSEAPEGWHEAAQAEHDEEVRAAELGSLDAAMAEEDAAWVHYDDGREPVGEAEEQWFRYFDGQVGVGREPGWESGDAARWDPHLVAADEEAERRPGTGDRVLDEMAEMDDATIDTALAEEEERAERSWEQWMDEMGQEQEDPEARYVAGRDPRSDAEAQQFSEWDATAQAEAAAHDGRAAWDFTGTGPESATETETSWAGAGFTQPGPEEPEDAMTPEQEADELVGQAGGPDVSGEQRDRAAEYSGQYVRGQADAQNGAPAAPGHGTDQETAGYSAGHRWSESHPAPYQQARGDQRQQDQAPDRQMEG